MILCAWSLCVALSQYRPDHLCLTCMPCNSKLARSTACCAASGLAPPKRMPHPEPARSLSRPGALSSAWLSISSSRSVKVVIQQLEVAHSSKHPLGCPLPLQACSYDWCCLSPAVSCSCRARFYAHLAVLPRSSLIALFAQPFSTGGFAASVALVAACTDSLEARV